MSSNETGPRSGAAGGVVVLDGVEVRECEAAGSPELKGRGRTVLAILG